jgi:phage baseplate assembly protein W
MDLYGAPYPIQKTPQGLLAPIRGSDAIKADLLQLILTNPGERVMLPDFGTPLRSILFEQNSLSLTETVRSMILASISQWEPRIAVTSLEVTTEGSLVNAGAYPSAETGNNLYINIKFSTPDKIQAVEQLSIQLPLGAQ